MIKLVNIFNCNANETIFDTNDTRNVIRMNYFFIELIKKYNIPYYLKYLNEKSILIYLDEKIMIDIVKKYCIYNDKKKQYHIDYDIIYKENVLNLIPFYNIYNLRYSKKYNIIPTLLTFFKNNLREVRGPNDLILYKINSDNSKEYLSLIHVDDMDKFLFECKIRKSKKHKDYDKIFKYEEFTDYMLVTEFLKNKIENSVSVKRYRTKFYTYCFLNNIPIYYNMVMDNKKNISKLMLHKFIKQDDFDAIDIFNIYNKKLVRSSLVEHFENNPDCFVKITFILRDLMNIESKNIPKFLKRSTEWFKNNIHLFEESKKFIIQTDKSPPIHKNDIYLIKNYVRTLI